MTQSESEGASEVAARAALYSKKTLYLVGTPIGNLGDITHRAIEALSHVDLVLCEDTRRSLALLNHLGIKKRVERMDEQTSREASARVVRWLSQGHSAALITDAGMPGLSDPGAVLVQAARAAGLAVTVVPGPSAVSSAFALSGFTGPFTFLGFLSRKGSVRRKQLQELAKTPHAVVIFEAPGRVATTLNQLVELCPDRLVAVARELTKRNEELALGTVRELAERTDFRGEVTLVFGPSESASEQVVTQEELDTEIEKQLKKGAGPKSVAEDLAVRFSVSKKAVYQRALTLKRP